jgi:predicted secreted protein
MPGLAGKKARLKVGTTLVGATNIVAGLKSVSLEIDGQTVDDNEFGVDWMQRLQTLKDWKISASGSYRPSDALGQVAIRSSLINDTDLYAAFLPDNGTTANAGLKGQIIVTKFSIEPPVDGISAVSIELQGTGAPTLV